METVNMNQLLQQVKKLMVDNGLVDTGVQVSVELSEHNYTRGIKTEYKAYMWTNVATESLLSASGTTPETLLIRCTAILSEYKVKNEPAAQIEV